MFIDSVPEKTIYFESLCDYTNPNRYHKGVNYNSGKPFFPTDNSFLNVIRRAFDVDGDEITVESPTTGAQEKVELSDLTSRRQRHGGKALWVMIMKDTSYFNCVQRCQVHLINEMKINDDVVLIVHETNRVDDKFVRSSRAVSYYGINNGVFHTQYNPKDPKCADLSYLKKQMVDALFNNALPPVQSAWSLRSNHQPPKRKKKMKRKPRQRSQLTSSSDLTPKIVSAAK